MSQQHLIGTAFEYEWAGNVLTRTQTIAVVESVTIYDYDAANQLATAQTSGESIVRRYTSTPSASSSGPGIMMAPPGRPRSSPTFNSQRHIQG